jgi:hypothetical protein
MPKGRRKPVEASSGHPHHYPDVQITLPGGLAEALRSIAKQERRELGLLVINLISEALSHRVALRNFRDSHLDMPSEP